MAGLQLAHETWFHDPLPERLVVRGRGPDTGLPRAAVLLTLAVRAIASRWPGVDVPFLARLVPWMPFAIRIHLAGSLVGLLSLGYYLSPAMDLEADVAGIALGATMIAVAISMATGWQTRAGAWLLIAAGPVGMLEFGFWAVLQRVDLLGLAVFILLAPPRAPAAGPRTTRSARRATPRPSTRPRPSGLCAWRRAAR